MVRWNWNDYDVVNWLAWICGCKFWNRNRFVLNHQNCSVDRSLTKYNFSKHALQPEKKNCNYLGEKENIKLIFWRVFDNSFSKSLIFKRVCCKHWLLLAIYQKKGFGTSFWWTFSAYFFHKTVSYLIFYQLTKFQHQNFFFSQDIKKYAFLSSCLANTWHHKF